ncbi:MAG: sulfite exporter TauE/SafE family protein [Treponema sp.]|nr:sulfite exporter TauE/SafE family protein [Treponema sp.]
MDNTKLKTDRLKIGGMTCINCQKKIERELSKLSGVKSVTVSWKKGNAEITYDESLVSRDEIAAQIKKLGYTVLDGKVSRAMIREGFFYVAIIVLLFSFLQKTGIINILVPSSLASSKMGYGLLFVTGLLTSVHCLAMCGGINASQSLMQLTRGKKTAGLFLAPLVYNIGRVTSYTLIGLVLGSIGFFLESASGANPSIPLNLQGLLKIIAGVFMLAAGLSLTGLFTFVRKFSPHLPAFLSNRITSAQAKNAAPFIVGFLNGFMPCGPLQAMWLVALAAAHPVGGALSMLTFSLGTVPLMLGVGSVLSLLGKKYREVVMKAGAILVIVMALSMLSQGFALGGWTSSGESGGKAATEKNVPEVKKQSSSGIEMKDGKQIVKSTLNPYRYPVITVKKGIPVHWEIEANENTLNGCNYRMIFRDFGFQYQMDYGTNVIEFTPQKVGKYPYTCWMGMVRGMITVEE